MYASRGIGPVLAGLLATPGAALATNTGRLQMLAGEARELLEPAAATVGDGGWPVLIALPLLSMVAAFLGAWLGIRTLSFGRVREKEGWREVAYRFRSDGRLTLGKDVIQRMSGVLDEVEDLGRKLKGDTPAVATAGSPAAVDPDPAPVMFSRRGERGADRGTRYRHARSLLRQGHDRETVRSMTGLKLAELDLLRCTAEPAGGDH